MPLLPEELLSQRYRIVSLLGRGEGGAVYRAWDVHEKVEVAIKEHFDPRLETQKRFRAAARRLSRLQHPQLPAVRDHFVVEDVGQYLVTDFINGTNLLSLLRQYGPLPSDLTIAWLQEACTPLAFLHDKELLHLDVKPANIRITPAGQVFLVDVGLPGLGIPPGERGYAAPEQVKQGDDVGPASDIYGLGATLYTLLTEKEPPGALQLESGLEDLIPAREVNPNVEPYLSIVATRAMSLRPDVRYENATAFARALQRPSGRPLPAGDEPRRTDPLPTGPPVRRLPTRERRQIQQRTLLGLLGLLVVILIAGAAVALIGPSPLFGGAEADAAATATTQAEVVAALTAVAPTATQTPDPTAQPTATPEPFNSRTGSRMLFVPGGSFRMGSEDGEADEQPSRVVRLNPYYIDETEVTNGAYLQCVRDGACRPPASSRSAFYEDYYENPEYGDYPVVYVNWEQARQFCEWREARLPSEAEWERAAGFDAERGIKMTYPWGDEFDGSLLNYCDVNCYNGEKQDPNFDDGYRDTAPVGTYPDGRSPAGAYEMLGNVMEWVSDWYDRNYYSFAPDANPLGPAEGFSKVVRGGSWLSAREELSVSARTFYDPAEVRTNIGFRCAKTVE